MLPPRLTELHDYLEAIAMRSSAQSAMLVELKRVGSDEGVSPSASAGGAAPGRGLYPARPGGPACPACGRGSAL